MTNWGKNKEKFRSLLSPSKPTGLETEVKGAEWSNIIPLTEPELGVPSVLRPSEDTTRYITITTSDDVQTGSDHNHNYCL